MTKDVLKNKTVVVTGAAQGIGRAIAAMYAEAGAFVALADKNAEKGGAAAERLTASGAQAFFARCDVGDPEQTIDLMFKVYDRAGSLDILINNAGVSPEPVSPLKLKVEEWDRVIDVNLRGAFLCTREAAKYMKMGDGGCVVNIASTRAFMSEPGWEAYAATKGGLVALTHAMALSLAEDRIRVNAISPGWIMTGAYEDLRDVDHRQHPSGRVGKPEDIARACLFLTDPQNDFITGENLVVDGGMTRKMIYAE